MNLDIPMPKSIADLPLDPVRKVPVPWFVVWIDGKPEFRAADGHKQQTALAEGLCWTCGQKLNNRVSFVIGPMCVVNRVSGEPPSHPECAAYSVRACPFLSRPKMVRRENDLPELGEKAEGFIDRNPGISCIWTSKKPGARQFDNNGSVLFRIYPPTEVSFWAEGRPATQIEIDKSLITGLPLLHKMAEDQGEEAMQELERMVSEAIPVFQLKMA